MQTKKLIIILAIGCFIFLAMAAGGVWVLYSFYTGSIYGYKPPQTPAQLKEPRVVQGAEFLSRSQFIKINALETGTGIGDIQHVAVGELDSHPGLDVVVAGDYGAIVVDRDGKKQSQIQYQFETEQQQTEPFSSQTRQTMLGDLQVIDIEGDGVCEYLARGSLDGAAVFDHQGKRLWAYGKFTEEKTAIDDMTAGDLDGDGIDEFVASWVSIEAFDRHGERKWQQPEEHSDTQIEIVDTDGDGKNEIVSCTGTLRVRNAEGQIIKKIDVPVYLGHFSLITLPGKKEPSIMGIEDGILWFIDFNGKVAAQFNAPLSKFDDTVNEGIAGQTIGTDVYKAKGVWVKFAKEQPEYLAVITEFAAIDRSVLYIYDQTGKIIYQEVLPEQCLSLTVLSPEDQANVQKLLVSGERTIWKYTISGSGA
jgi:hypothetical protein